MTKTCNGVIDKDYYRNLKLPKGWRWGGFDSDKQMHMFAREVPQRYGEAIGDPNTRKILTGGWVNVLATEEDIEDGNAVWMMENGYTRT